MSLFDGKLNPDGQSHLDCKSNADAKSHPDNMSLPNGKSNPDGQSNLDAKSHPDNMSLPDGKKSNPDGQSHLDRKSCLDEKSHATGDPPWDRVEPGATAVASAQSAKEEKDKRQPKTLKTKKGYRRKRAGDCSGVEIDIGTARVVRTLDLRVCAVKHGAPVMFWARKDHTSESLVTTLRRKSRLKRSLLAIGASSRRSTSSSK
ncbi:unnamed protein product [Ascophyllum nodosum]